MGTLLDRNEIARDSVTLVLDTGSAPLANTLELEKAGVGSAVLGLSSRMWRAGLIQQ